MDFERELILKQIFEDEDILKIAKQENLSPKDLEKELLSLYAYHLMSEKCRNCKSLSECKQDIEGMQPSLTHNGIFVIDYIPCKYLAKIQQLATKKNNLITLSCNLENIDASTLFKKPSRNEVYQRMMEIYNKYVSSSKTKGLYLHGPYGCGKSYIMACFANKYAEAGYKVVFAYFPDLVRQFKSSISNGNLESAIETIKLADVVFLDDFGGELQSSFIRDEVISPILQYRMVNEKLTFITSNLDKNGLHEHLAETAKSIDDVRAARIEERIKALMDFYELKDVNYRL